MHSSHFARAVRMAGLSLVELMIAMTLGLATVGAVGYVYLGTSQAYRTQDALSRLQESARYAFEVISNDLRMIGTTGCATASDVNAVPGYAGIWYANLFELPVSSLEKTGAAGVTQLSDALRVLRADISDEYIVQSHDSGTQQFDIGAHDIAAGDVLVATDCQHAAVFAATGGASPTLTHGVDLGTPGPYDFSPGSRVYSVKAATYYVASNPAGQPALYRLTPSGAEELVEGVEDVQVTYGVDTDTPLDGQVNFTGAAPYMTATQVGAIAPVPGPPPIDPWDRVVSVHVSLLMRTVEDNVLPTPQTYTYEGADVAADDRRIRKVFTHVVKLRNR